MMLLFACSLTAQAQKAPHKTFVPPFDFPLYLSGNFGEIRANHFHGGLDFKTNGQIGKRVCALADGYISRIRVTEGSGYVLDVCYDNGYTTINRHLSGFVNPIADRVEKLQYEKECYEVTIIPEPGEYPVKAGQQIAWSGNTGYSMGPHLHLDVFETESGDYIDPMHFFIDKIKDTRPPRVEGIKLFPQPGEGTANGMEAWGLIGCGIKAYDYMDGTANRYGVYKVVLRVDGKEVFRSVVDRYSDNENRMINSWTHGQYMKSFIDPGNTLRMLKAGNENRGLIRIDEERDYHCLYTLVDASGNTTGHPFTIRGKRQAIEPLKIRDKYFFEWDKPNYLQEPGLSLVVPRGMLYTDVPLNYKVKADSGAVAFTYQLNDKSVPLHAGCELRIGLRRMPLEDVSKYYVARVTSQGGMYGVGGKYEDGYVSTRIRELGTYTVAIDTIAPEITPIAKNTWGKSGKIVFKLTDKESGLASYKGYIDGKYALFGRPNLTKKQWVCKLDPKHVKKGGKHTIKMTATDDCGNVAEYESTFVW